MKRIIVGISGATGAAYRIRLLEVSRSVEDIDPDNIRQRVLANWPN